MTAVRTARAYHSFSRPARKKILKPVRKLKTRIKPYVPRPRARSIRHRVTRSRDPDPHLAGRA